MILYLFLLLNILNAQTIEQTVKTCTVCHGTNGISINNVWPNISGQKNEYMIKQLQNFRDGTRYDPLMSPVSKMLTDTEITALANYFSNLKRGAMKLFALLLLVLMGCAPNGPHQPLDSTPAGSETESSVITYDQVRPLFATYCSACHPGRSAPNWLDYPQARVFAISGRLVQRVLVERSMPPPTSAQAAIIPDKVRQTLGNWAKGGALLNADDPPPTE